MKKLILICCMLLSAEAVFAQLGAAGATDNVFVVSIGVQQRFVNNPEFNTWALSNYNKNFANKINGEGDFTYFKNWYDAGIHLSSSNSFINATLYFGLRLTSPKSKISSYLNFDAGVLSFQSFNMVPVNYTPTPDEQGKQLKLTYESYYLGLTSKNYLNDLHFHFGKHKKISFNTGFYVSAGYDPFNDRSWTYGYDDTANETIDSDGNTDIPFKGVNINNIPLLNRFFMEAGIFVGIGN